MLARLKKKKNTAVKFYFYINETPKYYLKHKTESFNPCFVTKFTLKCVEHI